MDFENLFMILVLLEAAADKARALKEPVIGWRRKLFLPGANRKLEEFRKKIGDFSKNLPKEKRELILKELEKSFSGTWTD